MAFWEEEGRDKVPFSSPVKTSLLMLTLITWQRWCWPGFSTVNWNTHTHTRPCPLCTLGREVTMGSPRLKSGELRSTALGVETLCQLPGMLHGRCISPAPPPLTSSVVCLYQYGLVHIFFKTPLLWYKFLYSKLYIFLMWIFVLFFGLYSSLFCCSDHSSFV